MNAKPKHTVKLYKIITTTEKYLPVPLFCRLDLIDGQIKILTGFENDQKVPARKNLRIFGQKLATHHLT